MKLVFGREGRLSSHDVYISLILYVEIYILSSVCASLNRDCNMNRKEYKLLVDRIHLITQI